MYDIDINALIDDVAKARRDEHEQIIKRGKDKWVLIMCERHTQGVWDREGVAECVEYLPISIELMARLLRWQCHYNHVEDIEFDFWANQKKPVPKGLWRDFTHEGFEIAKCFKREAPDWTVMYFDEDRFSQGQYMDTIAHYDYLNNQRGYFQYEITAARLQTGRKPRLKRQ